VYADNRLDLGYAVDEEVHLDAVDEEVHLDAVVGGHLVVREE